MEEADDLSQFFLRAPDRSRYSLASSRCPGIESYGDADEISEDGGEEFGGGRLTARF
jgi:hypothetical protein